jgi:hypothetical protein
LWALRWTSLRIWGGAAFHQWENSRPIGNIGRVKREVVLNADHMAVGGANIPQREMNDISSVRA